jgi:hypothetical protein
LPFSPLSAKLAVSPKKPQELRKSRQNTEVYTYDKGYVCVPRQPNQQKRILADIPSFQTMNKTNFPQFFHA